MSKPELRADEQAIDTYRANRTQGWRAVGGRLLLTDQRVLFYPHGFDRFTGGRRWECALESISRVGIAPAKFDLLKPFNGSRVVRLQIECDGATDHFVVDKVGAVAAVIKKAVQRSTG